MAVGAVLTQAVAWRNVETAIARLKAAGLLEAEALVAANREVLEAALRPTRYYASKAERLLGLARLVLSYGPSGRLGLRALFALPTPQLREALLSVPGIGAETADDILLYGAERPVFVIDRYTHRVLWRVGWWSDQRYHYRRLQHAVEQAMAGSVEEYQEFHALLVRLGKEVCRPHPLCRQCPLQDDCLGARGQRSLQGPGSALQGRGAKPYNG
jgi:endonuclease-3 related protein